MNKSLFIGGTFNKKYGKPSKIAWTVLNQLDNGDIDSINACDELGMNMVFTKIRHFKH